MLLPHTPSKLVACVDMQLCSLLWPQNILNAIANTLEAVQNSRRQRYVVIVLSYNSTSHEVRSQTHLHKMKSRKIAIYFATLEKHRVLSKPLLYVMLVASFFRSASLRVLVRPKRLCFLQPAAHKSILYLTDGCTVDLPRGGLE